MRLLLVYPNTDHRVVGGNTGAVAEPLALEYLATGAVQSGHHVQILDLRLEKRQDTLQRHLKSFRPDIVGVTGYTIHVDEVQRTAQTVKAFSPAIYTIVGGHHATLRPQDFQQQDIDFIAIGEGVAPLSQLLTALAAGDDPKDIPGLQMRQDNGTYTPAPDNIYNIDHLPFPDRTTVKKYRSRYFIDWMKPIALLRTSVGCPFCCQFCSLWRIMQHRYLLRDLHSVINELKTIEESHIFLVDDEPFVNSARMTTMAEAILAADIKKNFFAYARADSVVRGQDTIELWARAGLRRLFIGFEAITDRALIALNKKLEESNIRKCLEILKRVNIKIFAQFIVTQDYSRQDFQELIDFIHKHQLEYPSFAILTPLPGTEFGDDYLRRVYASGDQPCWPLFDLQHNLLPTHLPPILFNELYQELRPMFQSSCMKHRVESLAMDSRNSNIF